jgi:hypothetical protein
MNKTNHRGIPLLHKIFPSILLSGLTKLLGIISAGVNITDQLLLKFYAFVKYWRNFQKCLLFSLETNIVQYTFSLSLVNPRN